MDLYSITENGRIRCSFSTMKRICMFAFFTIVSKWATEDSPRVPESEHDAIEDAFADLLSFLMSIQNNEQEHTNFRVFDRRLERLVGTINALKE